jgi:hypothetical protein
MEFNTKVVAVPLCDPKFESFHGGACRRSETRYRDGQIDFTGRGAVLYVISANVVCGKVLDKPIPRPATRAMQDQVPGADKRGHVILDRAAIRSSCLGDFTDRDTSAFAAKF